LAQVKAGQLSCPFIIPAHFNDYLNQQKAWEVNGSHYPRTCEGWLKNLDLKKPEAFDIIGGSHNPASKVIQFNRWRMFVMSCQELVAYRQGKEWHVAHYLFTRNNNL
jgi:cyclopropane-fatty-acyl-phospholipid synthase